MSLCGDLGGAESPLHGLGGMEPSLAGKATYDLLSLSNHAGAGMNGGHYFAYLDLNRWSSECEPVPQPPLRTASEGTTPHESSEPVKVVSSPSRHQQKASHGSVHQAKWVVCDDERVQRIKSVDGAGSSAYILFWRLRE